MVLSPHADDIKDQHNTKENSYRQWEHFQNNICLCLIFVHYPNNFGIFNKHR